MQTEKKVKIELPAIDGTRKDTPVKSKKAKHAPVTSHFAFVPKFAPQLKKHVKKARWNSASKMIDLVINETPHFEVYEWLEHIKQQTADAMKGPFGVDLDNDTISLDFFDPEDTPVGGVCFKNITLEKHKCTVSDSCDGTLNHKVRLSYESVERTPTEKLRHWDSSVYSVDHQNEEADDEWQSVEDA
jgi:hypothetical protein